MSVNIADFYNKYFSKSRISPVGDATDFVVNKKRLKIIGVSGRRKKIKITPNDLTFDALIIVRESTKNKLGYSYECLSLEHACTYNNKSGKWLDLKKASFQVGYSVI